MTVLKSETTPLQTEADIVRVRQAVRQWAIHQGFSLVDQTKLVTACTGREERGTRSAQRPAYG